MEYLRNEEHPIGLGQGKISRDVKKVVLDDVFWDQCANFKWMVGPVVKALREFDAKELTLGKASVILRDLEKHVFSLLHEIFKLDVVKARFCTRKEIISSELQCNAAL